MTAWKTAIVGFGQIAAGYSDDPAQRRWYQHPTHADALRANGDFEWCAVVDPSPAARERAQSVWGIGNVAASPAELRGAEQIDVAVIATPPAARGQVIEAFPKLRAVLVEKPLGVDVAAAKAFVDECRRRHILVAVNLPRRYDSDLRRLAAGELVSRVGRAQAAFGTYGNGLRNNGTHLIDLVQMLLGPVVAANLSGGRIFAEGPIDGDLNVPFVLTLESGLSVMAQPLRFSCYREVSLDVWGESGRLQLLHEGLTEIATSAGDNRQLTGAAELQHDRSEVRTTSIGRAFSNLYVNLAATLAGREALVCDGDTALGTMRIVEDLYQQARRA